MRTVQAKNFPANPHVSGSDVIAKAIRAARTQAGLRLIDAAGLAGVSNQTLVAIEAGSPGVSIGKILQVADALGVSLFVAPAGDRERIKKLIVKEWGKE